MKNRIIRYLLLLAAFLIGSMHLLFAAVSTTEAGRASELSAVKGLTRQVEVALDNLNDVFKAHKSAPSFRWLSSEVNFEKAETDDDYVPDALELPSVTGSLTPCPFHPLAVIIAGNTCSRHYIYSHYSSYLYIRYQIFRI